RHFEDAAVGAVMGATLQTADASVDQFMRDVRGVYGITNESPNGIALVEWVTGGNTSYRRSALLQAGMSDERFSGTGWYEDADLAVRVRHLGYKLLLDPKIKLVHLALQSGGCANRDPQWTDRREKEHLQLFTFYNIKNRHILGFREVSKALLKAYRRYSLNRALLRRGCRELLRRHSMYLACVVRAFCWSVSSKMLRG